MRQARARGRTDGGSVAHAAVVPTREGRALQRALISAIAHRRGYVDWTVDHASWVVTLLYPERQDFYGKTLEEGLAWCLVWLMALELGIAALDRNAVCLAAAPCMSLVAYELP